LVRARRKRRARGHVEVAEADEVVVILERAFMRVEAPTPHVATVRGNDALHAGGWDLELGGDRVRFVLGVDRRVLAQPAHAREQQLRAAVHCQWTTGDVWV